MAVDVELASRFATPSSHVARFPRVGCITIGNPKSLARQGRRDPETDLELGPVCSNYRDRSRNRRNRRISRPRFH